MLATLGERRPDLSQTTYLGLQAESRGSREKRGTGPVAAGGDKITQSSRSAGPQGLWESGWPLAGAFLGLSCWVHRRGSRAQDMRRDPAILGRRGPGLPPHRPQPPALRLKGGSWRTRGERPLRYRGAPPPRRAPHQLPRLPALCPSPLFQDHRRAGTDALRADPTRRGPNTSRPSAVPSAPWRPGHSHPLPAAGSPGRPPPAPGPGLAVYLSSSPRRAPGRWRPRGDIRAPGSGSRPHLPAPRRRGGGATSGSRGRAHRAGRRGCPGSRPPLRDVRLAAQTRDRGRDARSPARHRPLTLAGEAGKEGKGDRGARPPASSAAWRGAVSPRVVRGPDPPPPRRGRGARQTPRGEAQAGSQGL